MYNEKELFFRKRKSDPSSFGFLGFFHWSR